MDPTFLASSPRPLRVLRNDAFVGLGFAALVLIGMWSGGPSPWWVGVGSALTTGVLVAIRRTHPILFCALASVFTGIAVSTLAFGSLLFGCIAVLMGTYAVAAFAPRPLRHLGLLPLPAALITLAGMIHFGWFSGGDVGAPGGEDAWAVFLASALVIGFAFVAVWALGLTRRAQLVEIVRDHERANLLERDAHRLAQLAVADERTRIAREMHDIIAHSLASIVTLAEGGRMVASSNPEKSAELFGKISASGRDALTDVKRLLRHVDEAQDSEPARGVGDIAGLVADAADARLPIALVQSGEPQPLPSGMSLAIYRVAQESITNVLKHAPGADTEVRVAWEPARLILLTTNALVDGALVRAGGGRGLNGMRERAELFDGAFAASSKDFVFQVETSWPIGGPTADRA